MKANAICLECGTAQENPETGFCINGHDNWLEKEDSGDRFDFAMKKFKVSQSELIKHIQNGTNL